MIGNIIQLLFKMCVTISITVSVIYWYYDSDIYIF